MTHPLIAEARELDAKATPAPWEHRFGDRGNNHGVFFGPEFTQNIAPMVHGRGNGGREEEWANAELIARSRTLIPQLADALEEALKRLEVAEKVCEVADTHVHYDYCSSHVGCNCENKDLTPSVLEWRRSREGGE